MHYFEWKGTDSREMGLLVESLPPFTRPAPRYQSVVIPGRAGELTLYEGKDVYEPYFREVRAMPMPGADIHAILLWLTADNDFGYVSFSHEPDFKQRAQILEQIDFAYAFASQHEGIIRFYCEPFKARYHGEADITITENGTITNPGDVRSHPLITLTGSGSCALTIGNIRQAFTDCDDEKPVYVDCDAGLAWTEEDGEKASVITYGDFPYIETGENAVTLEGDITSVVIQPRWRWL